MGSPNIRRFDGNSALVPNDSQRALICQARIIDIEFILVAGHNIRNTQIFPRSVQTAGSVLGPCHSSLKKNSTSESTSTS